MPDKRSTDPDPQCRLHKCWMEERARPQVEGLRGGPGENVLDNGSAAGDHTECLQLTESENGCIPGWRHLRRADLHGSEPFILSSPTSLHLLCPLPPPLLGDFSGQVLPSLPPPRPLLALTPFPRPGVSLRGTSSFRLSHPPPSSMAENTPKGPSSPHPPPNAALQFPFSSLPYCRSFS